MESAVASVAGMSPLSLAVVAIFVLVVLVYLPSLIRRLGITKVGPVEMEHKAQVQNYEINRRVEEIDTDNREALWDMTEDLFFAAGESSSIKCEAAVGYILELLASPIRTMVLLNHIAPKLVVSEEEALRTKINRGIARSLKAARSAICSEKCGVGEEIGNLCVDKYEVLVSDWIQRARSITAKSCREKIRIYEGVLKDIKDKNWEKIYTDCIHKNVEYIRGMGYSIEV